MYNLRVGSELVLGPNAYHYPRSFGGIHAVEDGQKYKGPRNSEATPSPIRRPWTRSPQAQQRVDLGLAVLVVEACKDFLGPLEQPGVVRVEESLRSRADSRRWPSLWALPAWESPRVRLRMALCLALGAMERCW